jgi:hypothetical protein
MNKNNSPLEKNLRYEDIELNNKINEYNNIYSNNSVNFNINKSKNSNNINKSNNTYANMSSKEQESKEMTKIPSNQENNNNNSNEIPVTLGNNDINYRQQVDNDYNSYINNLKNKLSKARDERRKKEEEAVLIQHRITLLKNKEQAKIQQFKNMKTHINKILNNRNKVQENIKIKLNERNNYKKRSAMNYGKNSSNIKKTTCKNKSSDKPIRNNSNTFTSSQNNFYRPKLDKIYFEQKTDEKSNINKDNINIDNFNIDDDNLDMIKNNYNNSKDNIKLFKEKLIEKIKQDEEEKKRIEKEIAKIEEEENKLLNKFNKNIENIEK